MESKSASLSSKSIQPRFIEPVKLIVWAGTILNSDDFSQSFLVFNFQSSNMMICTINVLIACTICYTRLLSSLLLGHPLLCFYTLLICLQHFVEIHISFLSVLTQFQMTWDKSLMWPKGCSSVKLLWNGTDLKGGTI